VTKPLQLCSFRLADMTFGVDAVAVQEIIRIRAVTRVPLADSAIAGLINLRGQIVTAIDLRTRLGLPTRPAGEHSVNVVIRTEDGVFGLLVDEIGDVVDVNDHTLDPIPETVPAHVRESLHGAFKLPDRLLLVLVTDRIVRTDSSGVLS
jgi:purine-binding chemotaxis protein CheW